LAQAYPQLVGHPRGRGYAFAFDLPSKQHLMAYLGQRFWRGAVVFGAGTRTVRYRLSESFLAREVELLFDTIRRSLSWLVAHPNATPPAWEDPAPTPNDRIVPPEYRIRDVEGAEAVAALPAILDIEYQVYEPARRTPPVHIRAALEDPEGTATFAEAKVGEDWQLVGFGIGAPLEKSAEVEGPDRDPMLGKNNTMYSVSITVANDYQGMGLGRRIKARQLKAAQALTSDDGSPRYRYVTGRNRVGHTASMTHLNRVYGAHLVCVLTGQYEDPEGQAIYYRIPLGGIAPDPQMRPDAPAAPKVDLASGIAAPLATAPDSLRAAERDGLLYGPAVNKLTVMNYATPAMVRALEWMGSLLPGLPHLYMTNSRDELIDKTLRLLRWHRSSAMVAIGLEGGYVGHTTAAARSISDPSVHRQGPPLYRWPRVPHPADAGVDATCAALRGAIAEAGADNVFGVFVEVVQERTGRVIPAELWPELTALRADTGVPIVVVETATAGYRNAAGPFALTNIAFHPDIVAWWGGAQTGYLHVGTTHVVSKPLTMVSTWDGDELSLVRHHHQLRAIRSLDLAASSTALDAALDGYPSRGLGLYRVVDAGERADAVVAGLAERGIRSRAFAGGGIGVIPPLDAVASAADALRAALGEVW
jgi:acetylornithine/succinyldiaminopimelate/putrescine aminotransferase